MRFYDLCLAAFRGSALGPRLLASHSASFAAVAAMVVCVGALASPITYNVDQTVGTGSVTGTITTDGTSGILTAANISDWNLVITSSLTSNVKGPLSGNNSQLGFLGTDLSATSTALTWNFLGSDSGYLLFVTPSIGSQGPFVCYSTASVTCGGINKAIALASEYNFADETNAVYSHAAVIATTGASPPSSTPEPSTLLLAGCGLLLSAARAAHRSLRSTLTTVSRASERYPSSSSMILG